MLKQILWDFRLPRILTAILAGAALSTAGLLMQTLFRNPLADPFVLGVNSGASLGVALMLLLFIPLQIEWGPTNLFGQSSTLVAACLGAGISLSFMLVVANRVDVLTLLVLGLMLSYAIGATVSIVLFFSQIEPMQSFIAWSFGDFSRIHWQQLTLLAPILICGLLLSASIAKALDGLQQGDAFAMSLGVPVKDTPDCATRGIAYGRIGHRFLRSDWLPGGGSASPVPSVFSQPATSQSTSSQHSNGQSARLGGRPRSASAGF